LRLEIDETRMKTIAIDIRPLLAGIGGVPEYTRQIVTHLVRNHPEYFYIFFLNSFRSVQNESFFSAPNTARVFFQCPSKIFNASLFSFGLPHIDILIQKHFGKRIDLFFAPNIDFFSFSGKIPTVVTIHDVTFDLYQECFSMKQRLWHHMVDPSRIFRTVTKCIAVSEHTKKDIVRLYGSDAEKIHVIPLGIDPLFFQKPTQLQENFTGISGKYILALGARDQRKNALHVIRAYSEARSRAPLMAQCKLVILGGAYPLSSLRSAVDMYGISDSVFFLDSVSTDTLRILFSRARVFVYPSLYEGFGLPPIEAMACGTPVIVAGHSSLSEVSGDGAYCVDAHHTTSLSRALIACTLDKRVRRYYIEKGRICSQKFSWDVSAKKTVELFSQLV